MRRDAFQRRVCTCRFIGLVAIRCEPPHQALANRGFVIDDQYNWTRILRHDARRADLEEIHKAAVTALDLLEHLYPVAAVTPR